MNSLIEKALPYAELPSSDWRNTPFNGMHLIEGLPNAFDPAGIAIKDSF